MHFGKIPVTSGGSIDLGSAPPCTLTGSPGPFGRNPGSVRKESRKATFVPKESAPESQNRESLNGGSPYRGLRQLSSQHTCTLSPHLLSPHLDFPDKRVRKVSKRFRTLLRLRGALFRDSGGPAFGTLSGLFSDSSGVLGPLRAQETLCGAGPVLTIDLLRQALGTCYIQRTLLCPSFPHKISTSAQGPTQLGPIQHFRKEPESPRVVARHPPSRQCETSTFPLSRDIFVSEARLPKLFPQIANHKKWPQLISQDSSVMRVIQRQSKGETCLAVNFDSRHPINERPRTHPMRTHPKADSG